MYLHTVKRYLYQDDGKLSGVCRYIYTYVCVHMGKGHKVLQTSGKAVATIGEMPEKVKPQQPRSVKERAEWNWKAYF